MKRAIRTVVRLIAAGFMVFGGLEIGLEYMRHRVRGAELSLWHGILAFALLVAGGILFAVSARLAERLTDDFDE